MSKHYNKQFKEDAMKYYLEHKELGLKKFAKNLAASKTALGTWTKTARENNGGVPVRGSGNYASDEAKEYHKGAVWSCETGCCLMFRYYLHMDLYRVYLS